MTLLYPFIRCKYNIYRRVSSILVWTNLLLFVRIIYTPVIRETNRYRCARGASYKFNIVQVQHLYNIYIQVIYTRMTVWTFLQKQRQDFDILRVYLQLVHQLESPSLNSPPPLGGRHNNNTIILLLLLYIIRGILYRRRATFRALCYFYYYERERKKAYKYFRPVYYWRCGCVCVCSAAAAPLPRAR